MNVTGENIIDLLALIQKGALSETENQHLYIELESNILNEALNLSNDKGLKEYDECCVETTSEKTSYSEGDLKSDKLKSEIEAFKAMLKIMSLGSCK